MSALPSHVNEAPKNPRAGLPTRGGDDDQRDEFVSLFCHELMTPVTVLKLQAQRARRAIEREPEIDPERVTAMLEAFDRQLDRLTLLFDAMIDSARMQVGPVASVREEVDLAVLVRQVVQRFTAQRPDARGAITIDVEGPLVGRWDRAQIACVLTHLVKNALTFGAGKRIDIQARATPRGARLSVRDRGIGIAEADQERIFGRFVRAVSATHFGGLGLGLFIARAIVEAHGGTIRVESAPDQGATFIVELPSSPREGETSLAL